MPSNNLKPRDGNRKREPSWPARAKIGRLPESREVSDVLLCLRSLRRNVSVYLPLKFFYRLFEFPMRVVNDDSRRLAAKVAATLEPVSTARHADTGNVGDGSQPHNMKSPSQPPDQVPSGIDIPHSESGLLLVDSDLKLVYGNDAAVAILNYPLESDGAVNPAALVQERICSIRRGGRSMAVSQPTEFMSGRRRYVCRPFILKSHGDGTSQPIVALLLERCRREPIVISEASGRFHLSRRECETVQYLIRGLTTKEVARCMNVSPNTVKQFVRLIMSKMGVTTRSGIVGKVLAG
jgi:DNA-binding CsgD family transcriptional regulator